MTEIREYDLPPEVGKPGWPYTDSDMVNHPPHYQTGGIETIDILEAKFPDDPWLWNVVQYCIRSKHKGNELEDLKKAQWYLERKIKLLEGKSQP